MNTPTPRVLIVVLNWNGIKDTKVCLPSLLNQTYKDFEILIVDNGSSDDSLAQLLTLEQKHDEINVIDNGINKGFAGGVNTGITYAIEQEFDAVALFNNDATADKNWLAELVEAIEPSSVGIATGLLLHKNGKTIDSTGEFYSTWGLAYPRNRGDKTDSAPEAGKVFGATGGASLYKIDVFKQIGLFDKDFFLYLEDVDVSFRAQLAGWEVAYNPKAIAYHNQGASTKKIPGLAVKQYFANLPQLFIKNVPSGLRFSIGVRLNLTYFLMFWNAVFHGSGWPALKGVLRSILLTPAALIKRRKIQKNKKVSAAYIRSIMWNDLPPDQTGMRKFRKLFTGRG